MNGIEVKKGSAICEIIDNAIEVYKLRCARDWKRVEG